MGYQVLCHYVLGEFNAFCLCNPSAFPQKVGSSVYSGHPHGKGGIHLAPFLVEKWILRIFGSLCHIVLKDFPVFVRKLLCGLLFPYLCCALVDHNLAWPSPPSLWFGGIWHQTRNGTLLGRSI